MKLAPLFAQFLYQQKKLELPGIGLFTMEGGAYPDPDAKSGKLIGGEISFQNKPALRESAELVQFIASQTGKQKALASSDIESFLELGMQFLNIGKPFVLEGIGSLSKNRDGSYAFTPGDLIAEPAKEKQIRDSSTELETHPDYKSILYQSRSKNSLKKPVIGLLVVAGLAFAVWGGYTIYKKTTAAKTESASLADSDQIKSVSANPDTVQLLISVPDTSHTLAPAKDSTSQQPVVSPPPVNNGSGYKYIFEVSPAKRAFARFEVLKKYNWPVQMETTDSLSFKLFVRLPGSDTAHILDSLSRFNGKRVHIE